MALPPFLTTSSTISWSSAATTTSPIFASWALLNTCEIIDRLNKSKINVVEGTVYPLLSRLKNKEYIDNEWIESSQGPPRKYFYLTKIGKSYLDDLVISYEEVNNSIIKLIKTNKW